MGFGRLFYIAARSIGAVVAAGFMLPVFAQTIDADGTLRRDAAVLAARDGSYASAITELESLRIEFPDEISIVHDLVTVLAWSERDADAVELAALLEPSEAPRYTQLAVAKSARNLRRFDTAAQWYDTAIAADAGDIDALIGRLQTAADAGDSVTAHALIDSGAGAAGEHVELRLAHGYALRTLGEHLAAISIYDSILAEDGGQFDALRGKALVLRALLLPMQALELAAAHPGILDAAEMERLRADEAAVRARLATRTPYPEPQIYAGGDRSLEFIDAQLATVTTPESRDALLLDRVVALSDANRMADAIAAFESLPASANREQPYVLTAAAGAYLEARQPETALELLQRALAIDPDSLEARFVLVYTWLDLDRYEEAYTLASELVAEQPMLRGSAESGIAKGNENRMRAELVAGIAAVDGNRLDEAQIRLEALLREAPNNGELRQELAQVYRWRGWLDRSLEQYRQVLTMHDDLLSARLGYAHAQLDAREYPEVDRTIAEVSSAYAREPSVQRLAERWQVHNERELLITAATGDSSGPIAGANNYSIDARWYTAPIGYRYRVFVGTHDGYAEYPEGEARRKRIGAGLEYRLPRITATAQLSGSRSGGDPGFAGTAEYRRSDLWTYYGSLELDSDATQLRAYRLGIESDQINLGARFAPSELASVSMGLNRADYSDGNALDTIYADGRYRVLRRPRSSVDVTGGLGLGRADSDAVPYYSPTRTQTLTAGLSHTLRLYRRYERELNQTISANAGRYAQQGFDNGSIWSVTYRIDWMITRRHSLSVEAQRLGQFFDGAREHSTVGVISLNSRF